MQFGSHLLWLLLLLLPWAAHSAPASADASELKAVRAEFHGRLLELGSWCTSRKLFGARHDLYAAIIESWPDDEVARKWNGYKRGEDGGWLPSRKKRPGNMAKGALPALREWQARIADWYLEAVADAVAQQPPRQRAAERARAIREAARIAPDHEKLRELNGEVRAKGKRGKPTWILIESQRSRVRRPALREAAQKAVKEMPKPTKDTPNPIDLHSSVTWERVFRGTRARILGQPPAKEVIRTLVYGEAAFPVFQAAFEMPAPSFRSLVFYSFLTPEQGNVFAAEQKGVTANWRKFTAPLAASWLPNSSRVLIKSDHDLVRMEAAPRQVFAAFLRSAFGIGGKQGWAVEGLCLHLTHLITGTRYLSSVRQSKYGEKDDPLKNLAKRLREDKADWMAEGRKLLLGKNAPDPRLVLGKTVNALNAEDVLYGYILSVFLLEGRREELPDLLRALPEVKHGAYDALFAEHLGVDVAGLEGRVRRWLNETEDLK